jgi:hypothetical protein
MRHRWWLVVGWALAGCAGSATPVPDALRFPPGESAVLRLKATGAQIYDCKANAQDAAKLEWVLSGPEARLYDAAGAPIGKHYAGPTWEAVDGSKVVGEVRARADAPDPNAIPWLLLSARSTGSSGVLSRVKSIQRIETVGGKPPPSCTAADAGRPLRVSYSAVYVFSDAR